VASPLSNGSTAPVISVTDSHQAVRTAPIVYFNMYQANYVMPPGTASGLATISIQKSNGSTSTAVVDVSPVGPGLFSGFLIVRVANGTQTVTPDYATIEVAEGRGNSGPVVPIDLSGPGDVFLTLFATGLRFRSGLSNVKVTIQGLDAPVSYAGAQGSFPGLDQVNIQVPKTLQGIADAALVLTVDGIPANTMHLRF
jgi:uncharacterized protein (TIGR03437 family)